MSKPKIEVTNASLIPPSRGGTLASIATGLNPNNPEKIPTKVPKTPTTVTKEAMAFAFEFKIFLWYAYPGIRNIKTIKKQE